MNEEIRKQFAVWGRIGGNRNKKKGKNYFKAIGAKGLKARWNKKNKHESNKLRDI